MRPPQTKKFKSSELKKWMKHNAHTKEWLAVSLEVSFGSVRNYLNGHMPAKGTLLKIAGLMSVPKEFLTR